MKFIYKVQTTCFNHKHANCNVMLIEGDYQLICHVEKRWIYPAIFSIRFYLVFVRTIPTQVKIVKYDIYAMVFDTIHSTQPRIYSVFTGILFCTSQIRHHRQLEFLQGPRVSVIVSPATPLWFCKCYVQGLIERNNIPAGLHYWLQKTKFYERMNTTANK